MAFWSALGKGLMGAAGLAAVPFTGGASLATVLPSILGGVGAAAGGAAKGSAEDRMDAAQYALVRDRLGLEAAGQNETATQQRARLEMDQQKAAREAQSDAYLKTIRGALARNFTPAARPSGVPTISFVGKGLGDSAAPAELERQALLQLLEGGKPREALPAYTPYALSSTATLPKASTFEKLAGILGLGANAGAGILSAKAKAPQ